jgi:hypothetical protein
VFGSQHAMRMRRVFICGLSAVPYFAASSHKPLLTVSRTQTLSQMPHIFMSSTGDYLQILVTRELHRQILEKYLCVEYLENWPSYSVRTDRQTYRHDKANSLLANAPNNDPIVRC